MTSILRAITGVTLLPLDDGAVLFAEPAQNIYALNAAAALVWSCILDEVAESKIPAELIAFGAPAEAATGWAKQAIEMFRLRGLLEGTSSPAPPPVKTFSLGEGVDPAGDVPVPSGSVHLLIFGARLTMAFAEASLQPVLERLFGGLVARHPGGGQAEEALLLARSGPRAQWVIARNKAIVARGESLAEILTALERGVMQLARERTNYLMEFRAALISRGEKTTLIAGPAGSGKSTLAAGAMARGWQFGTDERVLLRTGETRLAAAPRSLRLYRGSWPVLAPLYPEIDTLPIDGPADRPWRYLVPRQPVVAEAAVDHVIICRYRHDGPTRLSRIARPEGLQDLFANCVSVFRRLVLADIEWLHVWCASVDFYRLEIGDLGDAPDLLETLDENI